MQAYRFPDVFNESIYFDYAPVPTFAGHINRYPFRVIVTSSNDKDHIITLDSLYSKSYKPQSKKTKWSFLRPEVRFLDLSGEEINQIKTKDTRLYKDNGVLNTVSGTFLGVSGYAEFYFVDDLYNYDLAISGEKYTTIVATLETPHIQYFDQSSNHILDSSFSNSRVMAYQPHVFHYRDPDFIKITENGLRDYINPRWQPSNQYVVFNFDWNKKYKEFYYDGNEIEPLYFNKCLPSNTNQDDIFIEPASNSVRLYFFDEIKISHKDENAYLTPGYCKTFFNITTSNPNLILSAISTFSSPDTYGSYYSPNFWLSNPNAGVMSLVEYNFPSVFEKSLENILKAQIHNFEVPIVYKPNFRKNANDSNDPFSFSGFHSINSIAVLPPPSFQAWAIDSELNYLYKINTNGTILSAIDLLKIYNENSQFLPAPRVREQITPSSVVLDRDLNLWISFYDTKYVLNLDKNANFIFLLDLNLYVTEIIPPNINSDWYKSNQPSPDIDSQSQNFIEPTFVDIDSKNNIWVTYSNYASGYLAKFDKNNNLYVNVPYQPLDSPQDLVVDDEDNVWVALSRNAWRSLGKIEKRNTNGVLLSTFDQFMGINELTLDPEQNVWFTYSYSRVGTINNKTGQIFTFDTLKDTDKSKYAPSNVTIPNTNTDETALEGIACDAKGFLYVINSVENRVYIYNTKNYNFVDKFYVNPQGFVFWNPSFEGDVEIEYNEWNKSLQAHGDWMGTKWLNKFYHKFVKPKGKYITTTKGESVPLQFVRLPSSLTEVQASFLASTFYKYIETDKFEKLKVNPKQEIVEIDEKFNLDYYKINENFDLAAQIKSLALTPTLEKSEFLFETFLPSIYGKFPYIHTDLGIYAYEKIANFVLNNSDVDTCEIKSLYSLAQSVNENIDNYYLNYPLDMKRDMNTLSINMSRLFGSTDKSQNDFSILRNLGNLLSPDLGIVGTGGQSTITAGENVILKTKSLNKYEIISTGPINGKFEYTVDELAKFLKLNILNENLKINKGIPKSRTFKLTNEFQDNSDEKIKKSIDSFVRIINDKNSTPKTTPNGIINNNSYEIASQNILNYKNDLQDQIIAYANYFYPTALSKNSEPVLLEKCKRDVGFMVDSIVAELSSGTMSRSVQYALSYWEGSTSRLPENLIPNQKINTINTINKLQEYVFEVANQTVSFTTPQATKIVNALNNFRNIIINQDSVPATFPSGDISNFSYKAAADSILNNKSLLQQQIVDFAKIRYPNILSTQALSDKCYRDTGYIIDALTADLSNNTNHRSVDVGNIYFKGAVLGSPNLDSSIPTLPLNQVDSTIQAISALVFYINGDNIPTDVPSFTTVGILSSVDAGSARKQDVINQINNIIYPLINNGQLNSYSPSTTPTIQDIAVATIIQNNRTNIQNYISNYVDSMKYLKLSVTKDPILIEKCHRDVGYIVDAIAADIANNANHRSIDVSDIYYKGPVLLNPTEYESSIPTIPTDQVEGTISAINALRYYITGDNIPSEIPSFTNTGILSSIQNGSERKNDVNERIDNIIFTLRNNGKLKEYKPSANPNTIDISIANNILLRKNEIKAYMYDYVERKRYINVSDPILNQTYKDKCNRDIGLMVDAITNDLRTGVTSKTIQYALAYWDGSTSRLPEGDIPNQVSKTIDTVLELQNYLLEIGSQTLEKIYANSNPSTDIVNNTTLLKDDLWSDYYEFYQLRELKNENYKDNIIDLNNPQTTIQNNIQSSEQWLGEEKFLDSLFSYRLYRGLNIF